jgi:hypothetical protein
MRPSHFIPRRMLLTCLEELFQPSTPTSSALIVVLIGMGGVGKTQLALEYCRHLKDLIIHQAIFWLNASSHNALSLGMQSIAKKLLPEGEIDNPDTAVSLVRDVLSSWTDQWLMVFDNLDNPSELDDILNFFPEGQSGSILITSCLAGSEELGQVMQLDQMEMKSVSNFCFLLKWLIQSSSCRGDCEEIGLSPISYQSGQSIYQKVKASHWRFPG